MPLYIDAGTGGMVLQVLLSGVVGGVVFFKLAAGRIVDFFLRRRPETSALDPGQEDTDDSLAA
jgi:hypothetical protein